MNRRTILSLPLLQWLSPRGICHARAGSCDSELQGSYAERRLLNTAIPSELLSHLAIWDERARDFRKQRRGEQPGGAAAVIVLHLWADWCKPCVEEFPLLRELETQFATAHRGRVQLICVAMIPSSDVMDAFMQAHRGRMPAGPHFQDTAEQLDRLLRPRFAADKLTLPLTLLLDTSASRRVVRYAVAGSLRARSREFLQALAALLQVQQSPP